ncbi:hypothetical protein WMY93_009978 [Mugilogobius chulae]|uniref:Uncharacterized protein n=1 Tax=Mugilogobius chulae TaxID=88201 RepID=A0AAW0PF10_9GOBI
MNSLQPFVAGLDALLTSNATLRELILQNSSDEAKMLALSVAFQSAAQENKVLQDQWSQVKNTQEHGPSQNMGTAVRIRIKRAKLPVCNVQPLEKESREETEQEDEAAGEALVEKRDEADSRVEKRKRLEAEVAALNEERKLLKEKREQLKSQLPQDDVEEHCVRLQKEADRVRTENEEIQEKTEELRHLIENVKISRKNWTDWKCRTSI